MTPPLKNLLLQNHGGGQDPHRVAVPVKKKKKYCDIDKESSHNAGKDWTILFMI
jgi:hypothetical protein